VRGSARHHYQEYIMNLETLGETLFVNGIGELSAANAQQFREEICSALLTTMTAIEIDLSETHFIDSCGLGALVSVYRTANRQNGRVVIRLMNPLPPVQQVFELTRMHMFFEIARRREPLFTAHTTPYEINSAPVHIH
jgi:anti-sigma B factor antagonist